jgi:hypothetical protein
MLPLSKRAQREEYSNNSSGHQNDFILAKGKKSIKHNNGGSKGGNDKDTQQFKQYGRMKYVGKMASEKREGASSAKNTG